VLAAVASVVAALPALRRRDARGARTAVTRVLLAGAVLAVLAVTLTGGAAGTGVNLVPGEGIRTALRNANSELGLVNLVGNVVMFVPVGLLLPLATRLRFGGTVAACAALSVLVECVQLTLGRSLDVDDVLLNTLGGFVGALLGLGVLRLRCPGRGQRSSTAAKARSSGV
jgi:hypothetical protein